MKEFFVKNKVKLIVLSSCILALIIFLILNGIAVSLFSKLSDQKMAQRWSKDGGYAQVSVFFRPGSVTMPDDLGYTEYQILQALSQESIVPDPEKPGSRLLASCYSAEGKISFQTSYGKADLNAMGVGGDFFLLHEYDFISGSGLSTNDVNSDYCVIDESSAWKLFGSPDVAGQMVFIGDIPVTVKGVFRSPKGKIYDVAGLKPDLCFMNYDFLSEHGFCDTLSTYEVVLPNPVPGYAAEKVTKYLGIDESSAEIVDNTARPGFGSRLKNTKLLKYRTMRVAAVAYPYWENIARYYFDTASVLTLIGVIFAGYAALGVIILAIVLIVQYKDFIAKSVIELLYKIKDFMVLKLRRKEND